MTTLPALVRAALAALVLLGTGAAHASSFALSPIVIELVSPGGALPVRAELFVPDPRFANSPVAQQPKEPYLRLYNGADTVEPDTIEARTFAIPGARREIIEATFGSNVLRLELSNANGTRFGVGTYTAQRRGDVRELPVVVRSVGDPARRFAPITVPEAMQDRAGAFAGRWAVRFASEETPAVGVFEVDETTGRATGTFLTATGDYRFLEGTAEGTTLRLSVFDGAHAFLFTASQTSEDRIEGHFWSGNWWHDTWTAERDDDAQLPDAFAETVATVDTVTREMLEGLSFTRVVPTGLRRAGLEPDATGPAISEQTLAEVLPPGSPRMLYLFGTWCPNCADATRTVRGFHQRYGSRGLQVAGLAFENDPEAAISLVDDYAEKHGLRFPLLVGGFSDKAAAGEKIPFLDKVRAYPTTVFIRRDGTIAGVHTGFSGPATGEAFTELVREWDALLREITK